MDEPLFLASAHTWVAATPDVVYSVVSDLARSAEWSPECRGGEWVRGPAGQVGSVFRGTNFRSPGVVSWAPVARGSWVTHAQVVRADPGSTFAWAMQDSKGVPQQSVWTFECRPMAAGCELSHGFRMDQATEGIREITAGLDPAARQRFFDDWQRKLSSDLAVTVRRIKTVVESVRVS